MITVRELLREEIEQIWSIDRSEVIKNIYTFENGKLLLKPEHFEAQGWPQGEEEKYSPIFYDCFERGGWFWGAFDEGKIIGVAILESKFIGKNKDTLQLKFMHVSRAYRNIGLGKELFEIASVAARRWGARRLYISATPTENTVNFYLRLGCVIAEEPDAELFAFEPEDIHLECFV
jgi:GNAT superfamily N-acetyltransferase